MEVFLAIIESFSSAENLSFYNLKKIIVGGVLNEKKVRHFDGNPAGRFTPGLGMQQQWKRDG
ncbi:hypothetical protein J21TS7_26250 [Paenibacillus cineris]|uniref:Uncharacterized protein n=1 Tax=Paenibacillus cineris TaxID=237530 RepID=A0ABQ4LCM1_9BACL|nr:hypothetical protein J21TS7_26250 [Paenibacillus cineris]